MNLIKGGLIMKNMIKENHTVIVNGEVVNKYYIEYLEKRAPSKFVIRIIKWYSHTMN